MSELRNCPFCGSVSDQIDIPYTLPTCTNPNCKMFKAVAMSFDEYNTRPIEDALQQKLDEMTAYADKLANGLPEGMLPKDIENLRTANTGLAEELTTLRQSVRDAVEEINELYVRKYPIPEISTAMNYEEGILDTLDILRKHGVEC